MPHHPKVKGLSPAATAATAAIAATAATAALAATAATTATADTYREKIEKQKKLLVQLTSFRKRAKVPVSEFNFMIHYRMLHNYTQY